MVQRLVSGAIALLILASAAARAPAQLPTQSQLYRYQAVNRDLTDVLRGFAADQRLNLVLAPGIEGRTVSEEVEMHPTEFLDYITGKYGLVWYYDGTSLYIYLGDQLETKAFPLRFTTPTRVIEVMKSLRAYSDRYPFRILEQENVILAVAPPRMLEMVDFVIYTLESKETATASAQISIAVFPLRYASAADQTFDFEESSMIIPGVATILQSVVSGQAIPGPMTNYLPRDRTRLKGRGLDRFSTEPPRWTPETAPPPLGDPRQPPASAPTQPLPEVPPGGVPESSAPAPQPNALPLQTPSMVFPPTVSADPRLNAVVIRDHPDRMQSYEKVIEALDHPTGLVEITAKIIDVSREGAFEWGLPYNTQWGDGDSMNQFSVRLTTTDATNFAVTLLGDQADSFVHSIKALEQEGHARVASRPSLLTMDNVQAQINNRETFFVKIEGSFEVDLFDVSAGTTLNILPHIIEGEEGRLIRLTVQVDNGSVLQQTVNEIPRVRNDSLTTQAVLRENESLLIGGLIREEQSITESRVPVLGRLPGVGFMFRSQEKVTDSVERLILIEPKIVAYATAQGQHWLHAATPAGADQPDCSSYPADGLLYGPLNSPTNPETLPPPQSSSKWPRIPGALRRLPQVLSPSSHFRHQAPAALPNRNAMPAPASAAARADRTSSPVHVSFRSDDFDQHPAVGGGLPAGAGARADQTSSPVQMSLRSGDFQRHPAVGDTVSGAAQGGFHAVERATTAVKTEGWPAMPPGQ